MGVRRERPPAEQGRNTIRVRLPDGTVTALPGSDVAADAVPGLCCFCGGPVENGEWTLLSGSWTDGGQERTQRWAAHRTCLAERLHETAAGTGPSL